jgi:hypothetical protein
VLLFWPGLCEFCTSGDAVSQLLLLECRTPEEYRLRFCNMYSRRPFNVGHLGCSVSLHLFVHSKVLRTLHTMNTTYTKPWVQHTALSTNSPAKITTAQATSVIINPAGQQARDITDVPSLHTWLPTAVSPSGSVPCPHDKEICVTRQPRLLLVALASPLLLLRRASSAAHPSKAHQTTQMRSAHAIDVCWIYEAEIETLPTCV